MRILDVSPRVIHPAEHGHSVRTESLLLPLSARHEVRILSQARSRASDETHVTSTFSEEHLADPLSIRLVKLATRGWVRSPLTTGLSLRLAGARRLQRLAAWADVTLVEFPWQFGACRRACGDRPLVLSAHNVEVAKFVTYARAQGVSQSRARVWLWAIERMEHAAVTQADLVLAVSAADRSELIRRYRISPERVLEVPNGADTDRYRPMPPGERAAARRALGIPERPTALFAGSLNPANRAGLAWVRRVAALCPELTFLVTGWVKRPHRSDNLVCTGRVDDFRTVLAAADVSLCPIEYGGGTKIKLLESLAAGLPVVAFPETIHGLDICDGEHVLVVPKEERALANAVRRVVADTELAAQLARAGRDHVCDRHDWRPIADRLERALLELVGTVPAQPEIRFLRALHHFDIAMRCLSTTVRTVGTLATAAYGTVSVLALAAAGPALPGEAPPLPPAPSM
jgi:polysaccharide biosynthesis protein PslH